MEKYDLVFAKSSPTKDALRQIGTEDEFSIAAKVILINFYMDHLIIWEETKEDAIDFFNQLNFSKIINLSYGNWWATMM